MFSHFKQKRKEFLFIFSSKLLISFLMFSFIFNLAVSFAQTKSSDSFVSGQKIIVDVRGLRLRSSLNSSSWRIQRDSAKELFTRHDLKGIAKAQSLLVLPRIQKLYVEDGEFPTYSVEYNELIELGPIIVEPVIKNLFDESANTDSRKWSARLLGEVGEYAQVLNLLVTVIEDAENVFKPWHVTEAKTGLSILISRQNNAVGIIEDFLSIDHGYSDDVRAAAAQASAILKDPATLNVLKEGLVDPYSSTRFWSAIALSNMGNDIN